MAPIEKAIAEGMRITLETYPYYSGSGYAVIFLPPWAVEGGYEATLERLKNPALRDVYKRQGKRKHTEVCVGHQPSAGDIGGGYGYF